MKKSEITVLIKGLEAFTALLRNKDEAKNVDVQLYLEDFEKLRFKLEYIDAKTLTAKNVRKHRERLVENQKALQSSEKLSKFKVFIEWGIQFADYALIVLGESEAQKDIEENDKLLRRLKAETTLKRSVHAIFNDPDLEGFAKGRYLSEIGNEFNNIHTTT